MVRIKKIVSQFLKVLQELVENLRYPNILGEFLINVSQFLEFLQ